jgi:hypothetical protein
LSELKLRYVDSAGNVYLPRDDMTPAEAQAEYNRHTADGVQLFSPAGLPVRVELTRNN